MEQGGNQMNGKRSHVSIFKITPFTWCCSYLLNIGAIRLGSFAG